jgi:hypothetical protein
VALPDASAPSLLGSHWPGAESERMTGLTRSSARPNAPTSPGTQPYRVGSQRSSAAALSRWVRRNPRARELPTSTLVTLTPWNAAVAPWPTVEVMSPTSPRSSSIWFSYGASAGICAMAWARILSTQSSRDSPDLRRKASEPGSPLVASALAMRRTPGALR